MQGSFSVPGMQNTPESGSTWHFCFAVMHVIDSESLSHGPSSHMSAILTLSVWEHPCGLATIWL